MKFPPRPVSAGIASQKQMQEAGNDFLPHGGHQKSAAFGRFVESGKIKIRDRDLLAVVIESDFAASVQGLAPCFDFRRRRLRPGGVQLTA